MPLGLTSSLTTHFIKILTHKMGPHSSSPAVLRIIKEILYKFISFREFLKLSDLSAALLVKVLLYHLPIQVA